ncbi:hypothetical protein [Sorangium cellulosum]|uniref:Uncharacterized protein n=1 Tax=Sorangium cellulosum So0157-2 TaxID=1254432 RepID=S4YAN8_SORCE|nr:hypothetical protein [Sorangium cellulosum]AGP39868.1 hypothetical protein SCE1572_38470 [Sorangium cellulosum So0157-2]
MSRARRLGRGAVAALALACTGVGACAFIAPFPDVAADPVSEGGGGAGGGGAGGFGAGGSGPGGTGGGGASPEVCTPGVATACYAGPRGTEGVGPCAAGVATCNDDGTDAGACVGQVLPAFESCTGADENCDGRACTGDPVQSVALGGTGAQQGLGVAVAESAVVVVGSASGSTDLGAGPSDELGSLAEPDAFLVSFSRDVSTREGRFRFGRRFADTVAQGVALAPGGDVVLAGSASGDVNFGGGLREGHGRRPDVVVARFDASGAHQFSRRFGDNDTQRATAVAVDEAGNAYVTGEFRSTLDFGENSHGERFLLKSQGKSDVFLAKLDAAGNVCWARQFGDAADQAGTGVAVDGHGNIVLVGRFAGSVDFGGYGNGLSTDAKNDLFIAKLDPSGDHVWSKSANATNSADALGVAVDGAGNVVVTGSFRSSVTVGESVRTSAGDKDILVIRLDENGVLQWCEDFGDDADQEGASVATDLAGNIVVTGWFRGTIELGDRVRSATGASDAFVMKLAPASDPMWLRSFGDSSEQQGASVAVDRLGHSWVTGRFDGGLDLGIGAIASGGAADAFLVQLGP